MVCPKTNTLQSNSEQKSIDYKSMQVLLFLIHHAGKNTTKEQIIRHVWKDSVVNDEILSVAISKIRKALGDNARQPTFIKTLPNFGYCLIMDPVALDIAAQQERAKTKNNKSKQLDFLRNSYSRYLVVVTLSLVIIAVTMILNRVQKQPEQLIAINSIAVLPFEDLSEGQNNQFFSDGLSDAIINQLSQTKSLKVISRYSSFRFRGNRDPSAIGNALEVEALLDGSVQKAADQVRVNVRIFSTFDGRQLWSKTFDSQNTDIFSLQDQISGDVQRAIQPKSQVQMATPIKISSQAYEWFLMAKYHWQQRTPDSLLKAETYLKHSLELEPDYVEALVGLATTYAHFHYYGNWSGDEAISKALPVIEKALTLAPDSPTALAAKGMILTLRTNSSNVPASMLQEAQKAFVRSLELDDNATTHHWYSSLLKKMGKERLVIKHMERAIALNPLSAPLKRIYSRYLAITGKLDTAQNMHHRARVLEPDRHSIIIESTHVVRNTPGLIMSLAEWQLNNYELFEYCSSDAYCEQTVFTYLSIGQHEEANKILARMPSRHQHFIDSLALIDYGTKGDVNSAVSLLEQLSANRPNSYKYQYSLAIAQFRAGLYQQARDAILKLYPAWLATSQVTAIDITSDNYLALVLYGATLLKLDEQESATLLLNNVRRFLQLDKVQDKAQAKFTLAEINSQLGDSSKAVEHLHTALDLGWLETFDREWWYLQDNHLLTPLQNQPEFQALLLEHQKRRKELAEKIHLKLAHL